MRDSDRYKLINGPYRPPKVKVGDMVKCEMYGLVEVGGWTDAPIPWPRAKKSGRPQLILTGDLVRAVKTESEIAISYHWGVGITTIWKWRKALGVGRVTPGTKVLYQKLKPEKLPEDIAELGRELTKTPEALEKMATTKRGKKLPPRSPEYRKKVSERLKKEWAEGRRSKEKVVEAFRRGKLAKKQRDKGKS